MNSILARFNETVRVEVDDDNDIRVEIDYKHVYMEPKQAKRLAKALKKAAKQAKKQRSDVSW